MSSHRDLTLVSLATEHGDRAAGREGWRVTPQSGRLYTDGGTWKLEGSPHLCVGSTHLLTLGGPPNGSPTSSSGQETRVPTKHGGCNFSELPQALISEDHLEAHRGLCTC